jgi:hypothetical protein
MAFRGLIADPSSAPPQHHPACAPRRRHSLLGTSTEHSGLWKSTHTDPHMSASAVPSPAYRPPREIRCSSCCTAMLIDSGQSGSDSWAASIRRRRPRTTAIAGTGSVIVCPTQCGRGMGSPEPHVLRRPPVAQWPRHRVSARLGHNHECGTAWITRAPSMPSPGWDSITTMCHLANVPTRGD